MTEAWSNHKERIDCGCGCGAYGSPKRTDRQGRRHVSTCDKATCVTCRNGSNSKLGKKRQAKGARSIGLPVSNMRPGNEEAWGGTVRVESKSGAIVGPIWTRYLAAEAQSEAQRPYGDHRPFVYLASPDDGDGLVIFRQSQVDDVVVALAEQRGLIA